MPTKPTYDITFDVPPSGDRNQGMWVVWQVVRGKKGRWNREEQAEAECNKRNKALGWGPEWTGEGKVNWLVPVEQPKEKV